MRVYTQNKPLKRTGVLVFLCAIALFLRASLPAFSQLQVGIGSGYSSAGTDAVCLGREVDYTTGSATCESGGSWEIYRADGTLLFGQKEIGCANKSKIKPYWIMSCSGLCATDPDIGIRNTSTVVTCTDYSASASTILVDGILKVTWNKVGSYKIKFKPTNIFCAAKERSVMVVAPGTTYAIGSLSGNPYPLCSSGGTITYSVPAIAGVTQYEWRFATDATSPRPINMSFNGSPSTITTSSSAVANLGTTAGAANGTLTVIARTPCGSTSTRTFTILRQTPAGGISGSSSICVGSYGSYTTGYGTNHVWSVSSSSFSVRGSGYYATVDAYSAGSALMRVTYNRECDNVLVTESMPIYGVSCGYGTMAVAPNPATDEVEISYPETSGEYDVKVYNSFNKVVATGKVRKGKLRLDVRALPEGMYYVLLTDGKAVRVSGRLMKK